jgi:hypothetical protein
MKKIKARLRVTPTVEKAACGKDDNGNSKQYLNEAIYATSKTFMRPLFSPRKDLHDYAYSI